MSDAPRPAAFPQRLLRTRLYEQVAEQITTWIARNGLQPATGCRPSASSRPGSGSAARPQPGAGRARGDRGRGGPARRRHHGDRLGRPASRIVDAIRAHADRLPEIIETSDALETKIAALAAVRRTDEDLARIDDALGVHGGRHRGRRARCRGRRAVPRRRHRRGPLAAARAADGRDRRPDQGDPHRVALAARAGRATSLAGHRAIADAIRAGDAGARPRRRCTSTSRWSATSPCCATTSA